MQKDTADLVLFNLYMAVAILGAVGTAVYALLLAIGVL